jgi:hypothetical protein
LFFSGCCFNLNLTNKSKTSFANPDITTGKMVIAVRFDLCRAHIFGRTAKRSFAVRIFHGAR